MIVRLCFLAVSVLILSSTASWADPPKPKSPLKQVMLENRCPGVVGDSIHEKNLYILFGDLGVKLNFDCVMTKAHMENPDDMDIVADNVRLFGLAAQSYLSGLSAPDAIAAAHEALRGLEEIVLTDCIDKSSQIRLVRTVEICSSYSSATGQYLRDETGIIAAQTISRLQERTKYILESKRPTNTQAFPAQPSRPQRPAEINPPQP